MNDPLLINLHNDPRFKQIMKDLEVRWKQYKKDIK